MFSILETIRSRKESCLESRVVGERLQFHVWPRNVGSIGMSVRGCSRQFFAVHMSVFLRCMRGVITQSNLLDSLPNGRTTIRHHQISHSLNNSCTPISLGPARTLVTLRWCAAIFESIEPLLNLCYTHRIFFIFQTSAESYELFCFENRQVF